MCHIWFGTFQVIRGLLKFWPKTCSQKEVNENLMLVCLSLTIKVNIKAFNFVLKRFSLMQHLDQFGNVFTVNTLSRVVHSSWIRAKHCSVVLLLYLNHYNLVSCLFDFFLSPHSKVASACLWRLAAVYPVKGNVLWRSYRYVLRLCSSVSWKKSLMWSSPHSLSRSRSLCSSRFPDVCPVLTFRSVFYTHAYLLICSVQPNPFAKLHKIT